MFHGYFRLAAVVLLLTIFISLRILSVFYLHHLTIISLFHRFAVTPTCGNEPSDNKNGVVSDGDDNAVFAPTFSTIQISEHQGCFFLRGNGRNLGQKFSQHITCVMTYSRQTVQHALNICNS